MKTLFLFTMALLLSHLSFGQEIEGTSNAVRVNLKPKPVVSTEPVATAEVSGNRYHALLIAVEEYQDPAITTLSEP
ncbi:MAG: hypothetical protein ACKO96_10670, partial [Flammeovirgaceae bacterium]